MATIQMDIAEIRRTVYGRDMREPIADACEHLKDRNDNLGIIVKRLDEVTAVLDEDVIDRMQYQPSTVYVNFTAETNSQSGISFLQLTDSDSRMIDGRTGDDVTQIGSTEDFRLDLFSLNGGGTAWWSASESEDESYTVYNLVAIQDTYDLELEY